MRSVIPLGYEGLHFCLGGLSRSSEVEQIGDLILLLEFDVGSLVPELIEEGVLQRLHRSDPAVWRVTHDLVEQVVKFVPVGLLPEDLHKGAVTFYQGRAAILGNWYFSTSQSGFISIISSCVGVPRTLMISTSWSMLLSERKIGSKVRSSTRMQPADQTSICGEQMVLPKISQGARQQREQIQARLGSPGCRRLAEPKSQIMSFQFASSTSTF